jgi:hypothetical protein
MRKQTNTLSPSPNFGLQSESESESDEMAGSEKLCSNVISADLDLSLVGAEVRIKPKL